MLESVMATPRGRVAQLGEPLLKKQMVGWDRILAQTIEKISRNLSLLRRMMNLARRAVGQSRLLIFRC